MMQTTEAYQIVFTNLPEKLASREVIAELWNSAAEDMAEEQNIFIPATIEDANYACGQRNNCKQPIETIIIISVIRNPSFFTDQQLFEQTLLKIVDELRKMLNEPYLSVNVYEVNYLYLEPRRV